jgi:2',3'-cyclic-nucleotide 2'-phosphodiesterase (5'-nucleotidase family)
VLIVLATLALLFVVTLTAHSDARATKQITILHTNNFHGYLQSDSRGRGGSAYMAGKINQIRTEVGAENVALLDAGNAYMAGPPISGLLLGESTIEIYNMMGYDVAAYGNHEFDKGPPLIISRTNQSLFPWISANIVIAGTEWDQPSWTRPYVTLTLGTPGDQVVLGVLGLTTDQCPEITLKGTTDGLAFRDLTETVLHYYDEVKAQSDALIVLAHMGSEGSGPYKGLKTLAQELIDAGKPVDLILGARQELLSPPIMVGNTAIVAAGYYGRWLGRIDATVDPSTKRLTVNRQELITINNTLTPDPAVEARVAYWADKVAPMVQQTVGYSNVSLLRAGYESNLGNIVADSLRWKADQYDDGVVNGSVQVGFTNPGGLRTDIVIPEAGTLPYTIKWGDTYNVLPFGNTLYLMDLTGWQLQALLDQAATLNYGILQSSGITWRWYNDCGCATPTQWSAFDVRVDGRLLDPTKTYRVATNSYLAGGGDKWITFADGTSRWDTYYDMRDALNEYIQMYNATVGPIDHHVEGRILYTIPKAEDTEIRRYDASRNFAMEPRVEVGTWRSEPRSGIVRFPVNLPANVTIDSASLQLYAAGWSGLGANITVGAYTILRPVTVAEATWNEAQAGNPWAIPGCGDTVFDRRPNAEFTLTTGIPRTWYAFDVTALVQDWVKGRAANNGMLFKSEVEAQGASVFFASNEYSDSSVHPRLVIQWH